MSTTESSLDLAVVEAFGARLVGILNGGMTALMLSVGHRTGLFDTMAGSGWLTTHDLARAANCNERYVREWLGAMLTAGIVEFGEDRGTYRLPAEHATLISRAAGPNNMAIFSQMVGVCANVEDQIVQCFQHGGGVPYSGFPRFHQVTGEYTAAVFDSTLIDVTLPLVPGLIERLAAGIAVADIGAGQGHAVNVMAAAFPKSTFTAIDIAADALAVGAEHARQAGLRNAAFVTRDAAAPGNDAAYDLITTFDAVHDQVDPLAMVRNVHRALAPGGYWLCVDIATSSHVHENLAHPLAPFLYTLSCMHCMTVSLAHNGAGLGAMWGEQRARQLFADAGFTEVDVTRVPGDPFNNYYICRKPE